MEITFNLDEEVIFINWIYEQKIKNKGERLSAGEICSQK